MVNSQATPEGLEETVSRAVAEDLGDGDLTAALISPQQTVSAMVICREPAVICGRPYFDEVFRQLDPDVKVSWEIQEGDAVEAGAVLCSLEGSARAVLTGERTALNFLQTLSATATRARAFAQAVADTTTRILDTRKTLPGLRMPQKYAVRVGGASNHRIGLFDGILIKENHALAAGGIAAAVKAAKALDTGVTVQVEVENLDEAREAIDAGADRLLLDNFSMEDTRSAAELRDQLAPGIKLEASGGITLEDVARIAATGVDYISIGQITKDIRAVDLSMRIHMD